MASLADIVLQIEQEDCSFRCLGYTGVPAARKSWIRIVSSGSPTGRELVRQLADEIDAVLMGSSPEVQIIPVNPDDYGDRAKVLVLVASADQPYEDHDWYSNWPVVMTVVPSVPFESLFGTSIPKDPEYLLRRVNATTWKEKIAEAVPAILARAEITSPSSRFFISYRRLETLGLALQLFDRLTHEGFEVFLDRFTIPPGYDFQRRLAQELESKSMVVLLESRLIGDSEWTQHEIDFAKRHRLGLAALTMPDVLPKDALASITETRVSMQAPDFKSAPKRVPDPKRPGSTMNEWGELTDDALKSVVAKIKTAHANALFRRRHALRADLVAALKLSGVETEYRAVGPMEAKAGGNDHLVWLTSRPPEVEDFRSLYNAHFARQGISAGSRGLMVGPQAALEPDRFERLKWLHKVSTCLSFDEGNLADFARRVATGQWS